MDIDDEERMSRFIEQQIEKAESSKREEEVDVSILNRHTHVTSLPCSEYFLCAVTVVYPCLLICILIYLYVPPNVVSSVTSILFTFICCCLLVLKICLGGE